MSRFFPIVLLPLVACGERPGLGNKPQDAGSSDAELSDAGSPENDAQPLTAETQVSAGDDYTCATRDGRLCCWGANEYGQLGDGTTENRLTPTLLGDDRQWSMVSAGGVGWKHTCAVTTSAELYCWGENRHGELGDGSMETSFVPVLVGGSFQFVSAGAMHTCGIHRNSSLWCWGSNTAGQVGLGLGYEPDRVTEPGRVGIDTDWIDITAAYGHTCAVRAAGTLWCWGESRGGELGVPIDYWVDTPLQVGSDTGWATVNGSHLHTCAIRKDRSLYCWGQNYTGQLGDGTTVLRPEPTRIGNELWSSLSAGGASIMGGGHTCAIRQDGALFCWGDNSSGQLGLGDEAPTQVLEPTRVGTDTEWLSVSAGANHSCGLKTDRSIHCWGGNYYGQIGDGTTEPRTSPAHIEL